MGVALEFSRPGKPTDNAFIESFNGKSRLECLNANWFLSLDEARRKCEAWRRDYNDVRPHSSLGGKTPSELHPRPGNPDQPSRGISQPAWSSVGGKLSQPSTNIRPGPVSGG